MSVIRLSKGAKTSRKGLRKSLLQLRKRWSKMSMKWGNKLTKKSRKSKNVQTITSQSLKKRLKRPWQRTKSKQRKIMRRPIRPRNRLNKKSKSMRRLTKIWKLQLPVLRISLRQSQSAEKISLSTIVKHSWLIWLQKQMPCKSWFIHHLAIPCSKNKRKSKRNEKYLVNNAENLLKIKLYSN